MELIKRDKKPFQLHSFAAVLFLFFISLTSIAQTVTATAKLDTGIIRIGEQTRLTLTFTYSSEKEIKNIKWPAIGDTITKNIEVTGRTKIDSSSKKQKEHSLTQTQQVFITSFDSGFFVIPPFKFIVNNDSASTFQTEPLLLQVNTIKVDTAQAIKDIKPPFHEPFQWNELIPYIKWGVLALAIIALAVYLIIRFTKRKPVVVKPVKKEIIPPHVIALNKLEKLKDEKLWQEGKFKQYHSRLSDILRSYIMLRFKVNAPEQTTYEILKNFKTLSVDSESKEKLKQVLLLADLVKFAKEIPLQSQNETSMSNAFDFVNGTSRVFEEKTNIDKKEN